METETKTSYFKKYYAENKDKLNERQKTKTHCCLCNRLVVYNYMTKHKQSKICKTNNNHQ